MELMLTLGFGIVVVLVGGAIVGWPAFLRSRTHSDTLARLERRLELLERKLEKGLREGPSRADEEPAAVPEAPPARADVTPAEPAVKPEETREWQRPAEPAAGPEERRDRGRPTEPPPSMPRREATPSPVDVFLAQVKDNWMIWLGGLSVGLAGIFLVKYSIDAGLLGPAGRVTLGVIVGIGLHGLAEWLRRRTGEAHPAFAALAGGASITLYAAMLAALHLYQLLDPRVVFVLLALISLATMALALVHGPVLAIGGILGAYIVPMLVPSDTGHIVSVMIYSLIVSAAALLLMRFVFRPWLWFGMLIGSLCWWFLSLEFGDADHFRGIYLALLAYAVVAIPSLDFLLRRVPNEEDAAESPLRLGRIESLVPGQVALLAILVAAAISIFAQGFDSGSLLQWAPLVIVLFLAASRRAALGALPWLSLLAQWLAWLGSAVDWTRDNFQLAGLSMENQRSFLVFAAGMTLIYTGLSIRNLRIARNVRLWGSLAVLSPVIWLALCYLLISDLSTSWRWSACSLILGLVYMTVSAQRLQKHLTDELVAWLIFSAHGAYSLAAAMLLREAGLTLALSVQLVSLSWLINRFDLKGLHWLLKAVLAVIIVRLTFNPWLLRYPADIHWSLWTYGGSTLLTAIASRQMRAVPSVQKWLSAASLHLLVLTLAAEVRYWLYDGQIFMERYSLTEAAINTTLWAGLSLVYYYRAHAARHLTTLYTFGARLLLLMSAFSYFLVLTSHNPAFSREVVSSRPVFNLMLLAYGAPILMSWLVYRFHEKAFRKPAAFVCGIAAFVFVTLQIRHLWQGQLDWDLRTSNGELYTYSVVWMLMAVITMLIASSKGLKDVYKAGMILLGLVIGKIFLIDMSDLTGLLRVASFMGLGLSLLGLAYLHERITPKSQN